jgi:rapamycin-insensitive companion of mTOR
LLSAFELQILTDQPRLMEKAKLFTAFYHLSELRSREDLIKGIIENIDYSMFAPPRS